MTSESNDKALANPLVQKIASAGSALIRTIAPAKAPAAPGPEHLDLAAIRERLDAAKGPNYWRSLDEIAATDGFQDFLHREFPRQASEWEDVEGRRNFLKLMGASLALAGLGACTKQPTETIMPYVNQPESVVPGRPLYFASAFTVSGVARPVLVESHMGRPTKIEGNPEHPASLGSTDATTQASVLGLYDPDRSQAVTYLHELTTYSAFLTKFTDQLKAQESKQGAVSEFLPRPSRRRRSVRNSKPFSSASRRRNGFSTSLSAPAMFARERNSLLASTPTRSTNSMPPMSWFRWMRICSAQCRAASGMRAITRIAGAQRRRTLHPAASTRSRPRRLIAAQKPIIDCRSTLRRWKISPARWRRLWE